MTEPEVHEPSTPRPMGAFMAAERARRKGGPLPPLERPAPVLNFQPPPAPTAPPPATATPSPAALPPPSFDQVLDRLRRAFAAAEKAIETQPNARRAYDDATKLGEAVAPFSEAAASLRNEVVARIYQQEQRSLAWLAGLVGRSKSRVQQMVDAGNAKRAEKEAAAAGDTAAAEMPRGATQ